MLRYTYIAWFILLFKSAVVHIHVKMCNKIWNGDETNLVKFAIL